MGVKARSPLKKDAAPKKRFETAVTLSKTLRFAPGLLTLSLCVLPAMGQSKCAKIKDGVGNILVGEALPFNDDAGYKNAVLD